MRLLDFDEELLPPARWLERNFENKFLLGLAEALQQRTKRGRHWNGERTILAALGRRECDFVLNKIQALHR